MRPRRHAQYSRSVWRYQSHELAQERLRTCKESQVRYQPMRTLRDILYWHRVWQCSAVSLDALCDAEH